MVRILAHALLFWPLCGGIFTYTDHQTTKDQTMLLLMMLKQERHFHDAVMLELPSLYHIPTYEAKQKILKLLRQISDSQIQVIKTRVDFFFDSIRHTDSVHFMDKFEEVFGGIKEDEDDILKPSPYMEHLAASTDNNQDEETKQNTEEESSPVLQEDVVVSPDKGGVLSDETTTSVNEEGKSYFHPYKANY